jgi:hypothetical protein
LHTKASDSNVYRWLFYLVMLAFRRGIASLTTSSRWLLQVIAPALQRHHAGFLTLFCGLDKSVLWAFMFAAMFSVFY